MKYLHLLEISDMKEIIESAWENRELLKEKATQEVVRGVIEQLDQGKLRVASPNQIGWTVHELSLIHI